MGHGLTYMLTGFMLTLTPVLRRGKFRPSLQAVPPDSPQTQVGLAHFSAPSATYLFRVTEFFSA